MQFFHSLEAATRSGLPPNLHHTVLRAMTTLVEISTWPGKTYSPDDDGQVVLIEPSDTEEAQRTAFGYPLKDAPFEGVFRDQDYYVAVLLANNQFGWSIVVPDEPWLCPDLRAWLEANTSGKEDHP